MMSQPGRQEGSGPRPLIFLFFLVPGVVYGYAAKTIESHRDIIKGMTKSMATMAYYIVMAFFASLFIASFGESNLGIEPPFARWVSST